MDEYYRDLITKKRGSRFFFSFGYEERFDPMMLEHKPFLRPVYHRLFSSFLNPRVGKLLDIGCGTGLYWPVLKDFCDELTGVDHSESMIEEVHHLIRAWKLNGVRAEIQKGKRLAFPDDCFDAILAIDFIHHVSDLDPMLREIHRVLKPSGKFVVIEPNMFNPIIFLAHLIPKEERYGVLRSYAPVLKRLFRPHFKEIDLCYTNYFASAGSEKVSRMVEKAGACLLALPLLRRLSLRQIVCMVKS